MSRDAVETSDERIVERILEGELELFGEIVGRYERRLHGFIYRMVRDAALAQDLAQEVFMKVYEALDTFDPRYRFSTWIFRIARNHTIDEIRRQRMTEVPLTVESPSGEEYQRPLPDDAASPYDDARNAERGRAIEEAIAALPWDYRELIVLRHYGGLAYKEIAALKEMPLGTVKNKLFRGRQMLQEELGEYLG